MSLIEKGWTMQQIEEMDICYFFELMAYKRENKAAEKKVYIDQIL